MKIFLLIGILAFQLSTLKGQIGYQIGDSIAPFDLATIKGEPWQFEQDQKGLIIVFMSPSCPIVKRYATRLEAIHKEYASKGYPLVAINSHYAPLSHQDSLPQIQAFVKDNNLSFTYLRDEQQSVARAFGATRMPQCFLIAKDKANTYRLVYIGAIDDNPREAQAVKYQFLEEALVQSLKQEKITRPYTRAAGCSIRWAQ